MNPQLLLVVNNYQLMRQKQLSCWKLNNTILIPKGNNGLLDASKWRPITISSIFVRMIHKIMADRILKSISLNMRQKAFVPVDGCTENVSIVDNLIFNARREHKNLSLVGIDLAKAFDSVSHHSIIRALERFNISEEIINYILSSYENCTTSINCGRTVISGIEMSRGVKQGDPLSPILFNMIIDELLDYLPEEIGAPIGDASLNILGFVDDLILISESKPGMDHLLRIMEKFFIKRSLSVNLKKCFSLQLTTTIKDRSPIIARTPSYTVNTKPIKTITYGESFKYLGIHYDPHGRMKPNSLYLDEMIS